MPEMEPLLLGDYSRFLVEQMAPERVPTYSFLHPKYKEVNSWREQSRQLFESFILAPELAVPKVASLWVRNYEGLQIEKLSWQLPFGSVTEAYLLKPEHHTGALPGVLALHDHGRNKLFGKSKLVRIEQDTPQEILDYQTEYYGGKAWANELAKMGFAVLVHDVFPFESRRIHPKDMPTRAVSQLVETKEITSFDDPAWYHEFAYQSESLIAKSFFTAGLTWPGVTLAEDRVALQILTSREDVDLNRIGCCGLSLGGLRSNYLAGSTPSIQCSVTAGFMTTWADFINRTAIDHTWMYTIPGLPRLMEFADILAMHAPKPALVQSCIHDTLFTLDQVKRAEIILKATYAKVGQTDSFSFSYHEGPHRFDVAMQEEAFNWLKQWLSH